MDKSQDKPHNNNSKTNKTKFKACMVLHGVGDTIGYYNGKWEFMEGPLLGKTAEKLMQFIDFGGVLYVPKKGWIVSDDTVLHIDVAEALLGKWDSLDGFIKLLTQNFLDSLYKFHKEGFELRSPGNTTIQNLIHISKNKGYQTIPYDKNAGGSGASMRNLCIGLAMHGLNNRKRLIEMSIESSRITHNYPTGYLGGMTSALFTAFAIENIDIKKWPFLLMEYLRDNLVDEVMKQLGRQYKEYLKDSHNFKKHWMLYIEDRFDSKGEPIKRQSDKHIMMRAKYYFDQFGYDRDDRLIGSGGDDSVIIAYDALLSCDGIWEKLVVYAMLHGGDSDTTGCIAAGWYGSIYGFGDVPDNALENLEFKDKLDGLGGKLYDKFN